jgi:pilus assembly protein TadC
MNFLKDGLSIDEARVSSLIICLFGGFGILGYVYIQDGIVNELLVGLLETLIIAVAGVNAATIISNAFGKKSNNKVDSEVAFRTDSDYIDEDKWV